MTKRQRGKPAGEQEPETSDVAVAEDPAPVHQLPLLDPIAVEPLTAQAVQTAANSLNAQTHAIFLKDIMSDDQLVEVASRRGLLINFTIGTSSSLPGAPPPLVVSAPEFATVEFLKRRISKAKLLLGDFLLPERFALKRRAVAPTSSSAAGGSMERLTEETANRIKTILFNLGFRAGESYDLVMTSVPVTTDKAQQETMLQGVAQAGKISSLPLSSNPQVRAYQELLAQPPAAVKKPRVPAAAPPPPLPLAPPPLFSAPIGAGGGGLQREGSVVGANGNVSGTMAMGHASPRQRAGRWQQVEVDSLVQGVQAWGYQWAKIRQHFVEAGKINDMRSAVDLKDKWRNLVQLVSTPSKQARGFELDQGYRDLIFRLAVEADTRFGSPTRAAQPLPLQQQQQQQQQLGEAGTPQVPQDQDSHQTPR